jgi:prophage antirepressor-like protein
MTAGLVRREATAHRFPATGQNVRTVQVDSDPWFVAADVCRILDIGRTHDAVRGLDGDERGTDTIRTPGGDQQVSIVSEAGLYTLIMRSRKAEAKAFRRWVTHEVLRSIRRTGAYVAPTLTRRELAQLVLDESDRADMAEQRAAELEPAAGAYNALASAKGDFSLRDAGHILNRDPAVSTGQNRLMRTLLEEGMLDRKGKPYVKYSAYLRERPVTWEHPSGEIRLSYQIRITVAGLEYLRKRLGGIWPITPDSLAEGPA